jgi:hypothetical protein
VRLLTLPEQEESILTSITKLNDSIVTYYHSQDTSSATPSCDAAKKGDSVSPLKDNVESSGTTSDITDTGNHDDSAAVGGKRGRPVSIRKKVTKKMTTKTQPVSTVLKRRESNCDGSILISKDENHGRTAAGDKLVQIIRDAGAYFEVINGEEHVSARSGRLIKDLVTNEGLPPEEIPRILRNVLHMVFGDLGEDNFNFLVQPYSTYVAASERT